MKLKQLLLIATSLIFMQGVHAETLFYPTDATEIVIEKGGQLENKLKKANAIGTKKLILRSPDRWTDKTHLNEKDLGFLSSMSQLEELYLDSDISSTDAFNFKQKKGKITISNFPNLKKIEIGKDALGKTDDIFDLKVQDFIIKGDQYSFPDGITFENVYITSKPEHGVSGSEGANGFIGFDNNWIIMDADSRYYNGYCRLDDTSRLKIHSIHVGSREWLSSKICSQLNPAVIYLHNGNKTEKYLANYNSILYEEDKDLSQYDGILPAALSNSTFDFLKLPDKQEFIYDRFFDNTTINHLDLNKVKTIGKNGFYGSHIKEIHLPATVQDINEYAFNHSDLEVVYMDGEYAPAINVKYAPKGFKNIQFFIPKGTRSNYNLGAWKELRVLEERATTDYSFDIKEPGTLASMLTDEIKQNVVSLKLRGILFSDDIKLLMSCPNLRRLDIEETFIAQSPKELKEQQEMADYLIGTFMGMGIIAQSEYEHDRMSTMDNIQVQYLAKLAEMAKDEKVQSDPNCQVPVLDKTGVEELKLPLQLQKVNGYAFPEHLKKITLPPDLKVFYSTVYTSLPEIVLPASVESITITSSNIKYTDLQSIDMSACENPTIELDAEFKNLKTLKFPESYVPFVPKGSKTPKTMKIYTSTPIEIYFKDKELACNFSISAPEGSKIYIPRGSRAGYSNIINERYEIIEY